MISLKDKARPWGIAALVQATLALLIFLLQALFGRFLLITFEIFVIYLPALLSVLVFLYQLTKG